MIRVEIQPHKKSSPARVQPKVEVQQSSDDILSGLKSRPKTAAGMFRQSCNRVQTVEHESTQKQSLDPHLPVKKTKVPPWQSKLDGRTSPCLVTPGYTLARGKSKVAMYIKTDDFFNPQLEAKMSAKHAEPHREALVTELQDQIQELSKFLSEERLKHRDTKRKCNDHLKDRLNEQENEYENNVRIIIEEYEEKLQTTQDQHKEVLQQQARAEKANMAKQEAEIAFLKRAFESYKGNLLTEVDEKWDKKKEEQRIEYETKHEENLEQLKTAMRCEHQSELTALMAKHAGTMEKIRKEHRKDTGTLKRRFANSASEIDQIKDMEVMMNKWKRDMESAKSQYDLICTELSERTTELTDTKVCLMTLEQSFNSKVNAVDERYRQKINDLMIQNTEIRRLYLKKCGQLFEAKAQTEIKLADRLFNAKRTLKSAIKSRSGPNSSTSDTDTEGKVSPDIATDVPASTPQKPLSNTPRPVSAVLSSDQRDVQWLGAGDILYGMKIANQKKDFMERPKTTHGRLYVHKSSN